jgi:biotin carboxyl carrier protein
LEYLAWLEHVGDTRASYIRLVMERQKIVDKLREFDSRIVEASQKIDDRWLDAAFPLCIRSPTVGRWYPKPRPESRPYVVVGDFVFHNTVVGLVEVCSTFNEVTAGVTGTVAEICFSAGDVVEFNQVLIKISRFPYPFDGPAEFC